MYTYAHLWTKLHEWYAYVNVRNCIDCMLCKWTHSDRLWTKLHRLYAYVNVHIMLGLWTKLLLCNTLLCNIIFVLFTEMLIIYLFLVPCDFYSVELSPRYKDSISFGVFIVCISSKESSKVIVGYCNTSQLL